MTPPPVLFADTHYVVLDKPRGLPVHPGPRGGPSVEDWFPLLTRRPEGPWLAHRLDADTAGCLVVALRKAPLLAAQAAFASGRAGKLYWAAVQGCPAADEGVVDLPLHRNSTPAGWRMQTGSGDPARTSWRVRGTADGVTWLELRPHTGRTHQVRVHCAALGCPVLGDPVYGDGAGPMQLLARAISLPTEPPLAATAPVPAHMQAVLARCGWDSAG